MSRSKYLGVYDNKHVPSNQEHPYRVAIKRFINGNPEFSNYGYFKLEETAAYIYNIYAIGIFGKGAVINEVAFSDEIEKEIVRYAKEKEGFQSMLDKALVVLEKHGTEITVHING